MKFHRNPYDAKAILHFNYSSLLTGHYHMRRRYRIRRPEGTNDWLMILTLDGRGVFRHAAGEIMAEAGDIVLLRPQTPHDYGLESVQRRWELLWAHYHPLPTWNILLHWPEAAPGLMHLRLGRTEAERRVEAWFREAHRLETGTLPRREWLAMHALEGVLLWCDTANPQSTPPAYDPRIGDVLEHVQKNLAAPLSLDLLSQISRLSISRLSYLFRKHLGTTPQRFIESQRMERAKRLLRIARMRVRDVAAEVGFDDPFYFSQRFRRYAGVSPRQFQDAAKP